MCAQARPRLILSSERFGERRGVGGSAGGWGEGWSQNPC